MKILFYLHRYPDFGGIEKVTEVLSNYLSKRGFEISILSYRFNKSISISNHNISYYIMPEDTFSESINNTQYLNNLLQDNNFDIIIFQDSYAPIEPILFKTIKNTKSKLLIVEHNTPDCAWNIFYYKLKHLKLSFKDLILLPYSYFYMSYHTKKRHRLLYKEADKYILLSNRYIQIFKERYSISDISKLAVINNPVTISSNNNNNNIKKNQILFVGRFDSQKGIELLLKIWKRIYYKYPNWMLLLVGGGTLESYIKNYIKKHNIKNIKLEGFQSNTKKYYEESKILCMTSLFEGWGLVLTEAMSMGCIPISFNSFEAIYDIIDNEKDGYIIPSFDIKQYVSVLEKLMNEDSLIKKTSHNSIEKSKKFLINNIGLQWEKTFIEITKI